MSRDHRLIGCRIATPLRQAIYVTQVCLAVCSASMVCLNTADYLRSTQKPQINKRTPQITAINTKHRRSRSCRLATYLLTCQNSRRHCLSPVWFRVCFYSMTPLAAGTDIFVRLAEVWMMNQWSVTPWSSISKQWAHEQGRRHTLKSAMPTHGESRVGSWVGPGMAGPLVLSRWEHLLDFFHS